MSFSYWEQQSWLSKIDFTVVGSGIVGLTTAIELKQRYPASKILILEKGLLPDGASTKNAGFACYGSISEILEDLKNHSEHDVVQLVKKRVKGLELLRKNLGDKTIGYESYGGYELFTNDNKDLYEECITELDYINTLLFPLFGKQVFSIERDPFGFKNVQKKLIFSAFEAQIHTGQMMSALLQKASSAGIRILNNVTVEGFTDKKNGVEIQTDHFSLNTNKLLIATNGFSSQLGIKEVRPARAQVLITKPIKDLHIKGTFHLDKGFYYFRNIDDRILFGGGRNLDFKAEETVKMLQTKLIQNRLEELLRTTILPNTPFEIDHRWSGIMGVGKEKKPIIEQISENIFCGVRLAGMGIAIGSLVGKELADLIK